MIIARILPHAGLGNQMFMYAAGVAVAQRLGTELRLGAWDFMTNRMDEDDRPYQLSLFPEITERNASFSELMRICPGQVLMNLICYKKLKRGDIFRRLARKILTVLKLTANDNLAGKYAGNKFPYPFRFSRVYVEKRGGYSAQYFEKIPNDTMITGYWASEKYFAGAEDLVRKKFTFPQECFDPKIAAEMKSCNSVALHVRRGDKAAELSHIFTYSDDDLLKASIGKMSSLTENPKFFVFSDDIEWCKKNLPLIHEKEYTFIEGGTPVQDMAMMTQCRHVIVAPSTFSWWGAWLNDNPGKIVIAPGKTRWSRKGTPNNDLLPDEWIKID